MKRLLILAFLLLALCALFACDKSKKTQDSQVEKTDNAEQEVLESIDKTPKKPASLPRIMPNVGSKISKSAARGAFVELKSSNPQTISFLDGVGEIPKDQCADMHVKDMRGFIREEVAVKGEESSKIKKVTNIYRHEKSADKKIQADSICLPMVGRMERCKDPGEKCMEDSKMSEFFLGLFLSDNEGEQVHNVKKYGFANKFYACRPRNPGEKGYKLSAWYSNDYKGNGLAVAARRSSEGWFISNCRSEKSSELGLMSCLCSTLP